MLSGSVSPRSFKKGQVSFLIVTEAQRASKRDMAAKQSKEAAKGITDPVISKFLEKKDSLRDTLLKEVTLRTEKYRPASLNWISTASSTIEVILNTEFTKHLQSENLKKNDPSIQKYVDRIFEKFLLNLKKEFESTITS